MNDLPPDECVTRFIQQAQRLGIEIKLTSNGMSRLNAAYHAFNDRPGLILIKDSNLQQNSKKICTLLAHEMVHVLQHWHGQLKAVPPLGWPIEKSPPGRHLSRQEREAYAAQNNPQKVLRAVENLRPIPIQDSP